MASDRRIGGPDAKNRGILLDAAEQLMLEDGYAAVTSRRVAERAGLKPQLVHYYFRTMDDLFIEVFRRMSNLGLEAHAEALTSDQPLWALWEFGTDPQATRLTMEFMGLANHRKALRAEIASYADQFRQQQVDAMTAFTDDPTPPRCSSDRRSWCPRQPYRHRPSPRRPCRRRLYPRRRYRHRWCRRPRRRR